MKFYVGCSNFCCMKMMQFMLHKNDAIYLSSGGGSGISEIPFLLHASIESCLAWSPEMPSKINCNPTDSMSMFPYHSSDSI